MGGDIFRQASYISDVGRIIKRGGGRVSLVMLFMGKESIAGWGGGLIYIDPSKRYPNSSSPFYIHLNGAISCMNGVIYSQVSRCMEETASSLSSSFSVTK